MDKARFDRTVAQAWQTAGAPALIVCVSGGPDSVALLTSLWHCAQGRVPVVVTHCNFHLRGEESMRDQRLVERLCSQLGADLRVRDFDVTAYIKAHGGSVEMACRELRYTWFRELLAELPSPARIATGHNADDNIETLFLNLFRGSGVRGLKGMLPDTGEILRPLLSLSREDIMRYLAAAGEEYVVDSTNLDSDYRRNFIRNELLPLAETRWPGLRTALGRSLSLLREESHIVDSVLCEEIADPLWLPAATLSASPSAMSLIHRFITPHGGNSAQAASASLAALASDFQPGKIWLMPDGFRLVLERDGLQLLPPDDSADGLAPALCWSKVRLSEEEFASMRSDRSNLTAWLPSPPETYQLRRVERGDRIRPLGMKGSKLLSDVMKDAHMPLEERERQWVLTDAATSDIIWAPGLRRSRLQLIDPRTTECFRVTLFR